MLITQAWKITLFTRQVSKVPNTLAFKIEHLGYWAKWNGELVLEPKIFRSDI